MNFNQWKVFTDKNNIPKVVYCCGDQSALIEIVLEDIKSKLQVPSTDYVEIDARYPHMLWDTLRQYPLDVKANRLVVVRHADKLDSWKHLSDWLSDSKNNSCNYVVFISYQSDAPSVFVKGKKSHYQEHIELIKTKGKFIKCSQPNDDDLISWSEQYGLTRSVAEHLVERTSGDTEAMLSVLKKVHVWQGSPSARALDLLCDEQALDDFSDYLVLKEKSLALLALESMSTEDKAKIISKLDYKLDILIEINQCVRKRMYAGDIAAATGIKIFLIKKFIPVAKEYDSEKIRHCRQVLAMVDSAINTGVRVGAWELLVTLW